MIITHKLQPMDLTHKQNTSRVDVVQDDKYSRDIEFTLTENGVAWQIPDGATAVVRYKKPDGTGGNYDTLPDGSTAYLINGNVLTVALAPQVCTVQGTVQLAVGLIQGSAEINTFTVNIAVQPNPGATYQSEDYIKLSGAVPNSGWTPNMYLGTDSSGNVVAKEGTSGGGGTVSVDSTLTKSGQAADAAVVGNRLSALSEEIVTTSESKVSAHNTGTDTHSDIRVLIQGLTDRLNALADSDDTTLDQLSEVVAYIKSNRELIEAITTSKVSVSDIIDNLTTNVANKPLSAAQGVALKALIDAITIPGALPNPNALTFTGAVTGSYDGSAPLSVEIPSGGGGSGGDVSWKLIRTINIVSGTSNYSFNTDNNGNTFKIKNFLILIDTYPSKGYLEIKPNGNFSFIQNVQGKQNSPFSFMMKRATDGRYILENSLTNNSIFERKISNEYSSFGEFTSFSFWFSANPDSDTTMYILGEDG